MLRSRDLILARTTDELHAGAAAVEEAPQRPELCELHDEEDGAGRVGAGPQQPHLTRGNCSQHWDSTVQSRTTLGWSTSLSSEYSVSRSWSSYRE